MRRSRSKILAAALVTLILCAAQISVQAAPAGSPAPIDHEVQMARQSVAEALSARGLTAEEVESRLAQLSDEDVIYFASNLDQIQAAGEEVPEYIWWLGGGLLAVLILAAIL